MIESIVFFAAIFSAIAFGYMLRGWRERHAITDLVEQAHDTLAGLQDAAADRFRLYRQLGRDHPEPGTCRFCGCTDDDGCLAGCYWFNSDRTVCSTCFETFVQAVPISWEPNGILADAPAPRIAEGENR